MIKNATLAILFFTLLFGQVLDISAIYPIVSKDNKGFTDIEFYPESQYDITSSLLTYPEYHSYLNNPFSQRKLRKQKLFQVGDTLRFYVRNIFSQTKWDRILAELVFDTSMVSIWIESESLDSLLDNDELLIIINEFKSYLFHKSGVYSIDSNSGIFSIMFRYFGEPPDVDMDGKLDILLLDIDDEYIFTGSYVAGFFDPNDLTNSATSNMRDLIYIDIYPTIKYKDEITIDRAIPTLAHEYQHLIHANYEGPEREYIFINEGLSELAEIVCGFTPRSPLDYFNNPNRPLVSWNFADPLPDYARTSLWTHYLFEKVGYDNIPKLVQSQFTGISEYEMICEQYSEFSFNDMFKMWIIANVVNRININPYYGYNHPARQNYKQPGKRIEDNLPAVGSVLLGMLGCYPVLVPRVDEVMFLNQLANLSVQSITMYPEGIISVNPNEPNPSTIYLNNGEHGNIMYLVSNTDHPESEEDEEFYVSDYIISGKKSGTHYVLSYDDGLPDVFYNQASYLLVEKFEAVAIRYELDNPVWLESLEVNMVFLNEVQGTGISQEIPRDIVIQVAEDENGQPGSVLIQEHYHSFMRPLGNLKPEKISLQDYYEILSTMEGSFFIILKNDDDDFNHFAIGLDSLADITETQLYYDTSGLLNYSWQSLNNIPIGNTVLNGWNAMCRTTVILKTDYSHGWELSPEFSYDFSEVILNLSLPFDVDTASSGIAAVLPSGRFVTRNLNYNYPTVSVSFPLEVGGDYNLYLNLVSDTKTEAIDTVFTWQIPLPEGFQVSRNYPNPFNSATLLPYLVMEPGIVKIQVFDILGREIFNTQPVTVEPGVRNTRLDFCRFSSGIYFAKINYSRMRDNKTTNDIVKMTLVK